MRANSPNRRGSDSPVRKRPLWKVALPLMIAAVAVFLFGPFSKARALSQKTRQELRRHGFKVDLDQFDLSIPPASRSNAENVVLAGKRFRPLLPNRDYDVMRPVTKTSALVLWKEDKLWSDAAEDSWPGVQRDLQTQGPLL